MRSKDVAVRFCEREPSQSAKRIGKKVRLEQVRAPEGCPKARKGYRKIFFRIMPQTDNYDILPSEASTIITVLSYS